MLIVLSPAKSLDFESPLPTKKHSEARMLDDAAELVGVMRTYSPDALAKLMHISPKLADLNVERFQNWEPPVGDRAAVIGARPAILAFTGDVYQGMAAGTRFDERDFTHAQKVIRILSGLYGVLRPLDLMAPYRLEMGSKVSTGRGNDLYDFWGSRITDQLRADLDESPGPGVLVNLASNEYFNAVRAKELDARIVAPVFLDHSQQDPKGEPKIISFFAKRARGMMAGWMVRERVKSVKDFAGFDEDGYRYSAERSTPDRPVFVR